MAQTDDGDNSDDNDDDNDDRMFLDRLADLLAGLPSVRAVALAVAAAQTAHAVLAARGEWVTNEKTLLDRAGLRVIDEITAGLSSSPAALADSIGRAGELFAAAS